jgi:hypothetical protein
VAEVEGWVKEGIEWLEANGEASKEEYDEKQKAYEEKIKPVMMKLYEKSGSPGANTEAQPNMNSSTSGPKVEEVD